MVMKLGLIGAPVEESFKTERKRDYHFLNFASI